eukprot:scaffold59374_cov40-Attheya_sp.AAC.1
MAVSTRMDVTGCFNECVLSGVSAEGGSSKCDDDSIRHQLLVATVIERSLDGGNEMRLAC